jgi:hypothetical protein
MIGEFIIGTTAAAAGGFTYALHRRYRLYHDFEGRISAVVSAVAPDLWQDCERAAPCFTNYLAVVPDLLPGETFARVKAEAERLVAPERSFVPAHKKGGTVAYETLIASAPAILALYHCAGFKDFISRVVGVRVQPTPIRDQSSLSLLFYDRPGDHIGWHYDHNFYRGRHFTILIGIANAGHAAGGLSHAQLQARLAGQEITVSTAPNAGVVFEGARVRHRVTPILAGERRLVLSMTYCTDQQSNWWQSISRRLKDTAFFGIRALWT